MYCSIIHHILTRTPTHSKLLYHIIGELEYHDEATVAAGIAGVKLFYDTKLTLFNRTFTLDDINNNNNNNDNNRNNTTDSENTIKNSDTSSNTIKQKQFFLSKKSARNQLASIILQEIDLPAYEEMLLNQENVKKTLQNFRDGVLSGKCSFYLFLYVHFYPTAIAVSSFPFDLFLFSSSLPFNFYFLTLILFSLLSHFSCCVFNYMILSSSFPISPPFHSTSQ